MEQEEKDEKLAKQLELEKKRREEYDQRMKKALKDRGIKQVNYKDHLALRDQKKKGVKVPAVMKVFFSIPFVAVFIFGLLFVPWIMYLISTGEYVGYNTPKKKTENIFLTDKKETKTSGSDTGSNP